MAKELTEDSQLFFAGKKMTIVELKETYFPELDDEAFLESAGALIQTGALRILDEKNKLQKAMEKAASRIDVKTTVQELEQEKEAELDYLAESKRADRLIHEQVDVQFPNQRVAMKFAGYARKKIRVNSTISTNEKGYYIVTLLNISERELGKLKRYHSFQKFGGALVRGTDSVAGMTTSSIDFAASSILAPTAKAIVSTSAGITQSITKAATQVGSATVNKTIEEAVHLREELAEDVEVQRAKQSLLAAKDALFNLFNRGGKSSGDFTIR